MVRSEILNGPRFHKGTTANVASRYSLVSRQMLDGNNRPVATGRINPYLTTSTGQKNHNHLQPQQYL